MKLTDLFEGNIVWTRGYYRKRTYLLFTVCSCDQYIYIYVILDCNAMVIWNWFIKQSN